MKTIKQLKENVVSLADAQRRHTEKDDVRTAENSRKMEAHASETLHGDFAHPVGTPFKVHQSGRYPAGRYQVIGHGHYDNGNTLEPAYKVVRTHDEAGKANDTNGPNVMRHTFVMRPHEVEGLVGTTSKLHGI